MKRITPILLTFILFLVGCSGNSNAPTSDTEAAKTESTELTTVFVEETIAEESTVVESSKEQESSKLFDSVYVLYALRQNPFDYNSVKEFAQSTDYAIDIVNPSAEKTGEITLTDENGDYVYFAFNNINGVETIVTVNFYKSSSNSEVSMSNYSSDGSPDYDTYTTHVIGGRNREVKGLAAQREFLFQ